MDMLTQQPYDERIVPEPEKAKAKQWLSRIKRALEHNDTLFRAFEDRRRTLRGVEGDGVTNQQRTNLVYSTIAAVLPQVYAKNPDISVTPSEAVSEARYQAVKAFARTLEIVLSRVLVKDTRLKLRAKACVRSAMTTSIGWAKLTYQKDIRRDPQIESRMNDIQDNLRRLDATIRAIQNPSRLAEEEVDRETLKQQFAALEKTVEKVVAEGLVIDYVRSEDIIILDSTVRTFDGYAQASAIAQRIWMSKDRYETAFGYPPPKGAKTYAAPHVTEQQPALGGDGKPECFYCAYEIWSKDENTVYTLCDGYEGYAREPFQPEKLGKHWYSFFPLGFNLVDGQFYPMSDVELLEKLSCEYNETREQQKDHREDSMPVRVARAGGALTPEDLERIQKRRSREIVVLSGAGGKPLSDDIEEFSGISLNPVLYDVTPIRADIEIVSGASDATQGSVLKAKTATEAEILREGLQSRTAERQDAIEDWIFDMATYGAEMLLQELSLPQVQRIAGETAVWPQMTRDEIFDQVAIEVRAGSTGRPNRVAEREQWAKLAPEIRDTVLQVAQLRAQGQVDIAQTLIELLKETLRRFDERMDLDAFIPPMPAMPLMMPAAPQMQAMPQAPLPAEAGAIH
ncbi:MAG: hypothetical protein IT531_00160 [Burkholderiales bacterium]|nr:hypothetical protein [Burkholderiales bacterium]